MTAVHLILGAIGALVLLAVGSAVGDLLSEELRGWLDRAPFGLLGLAGRRLPIGIRDVHQQAWTGELHEILRGADARPITRLWVGMRFSAGLLRSAPAVASAFGSPRTSLWRRLLETYETPRPWWMSRLQEALGIMAAWLVSWPTWVSVLITLVVASLFAADAVVWVRKRRKIALPVHRDLDACSHRGCEDRMTLVVGGLGYCTPGHVPETLRGLAALPPSTIRERLCLTDEAVRDGLIDSPTWRGIADVS
ncbi:MAG TPA: hypothetical protein VJT31_17510 [Rugosimonospora sp.]|nr:hypothetical protein [Rugosimonospora sp.]